MTHFSDYKAVLVRYSLFSLLTFTLAGCDGPATTANPFQGNSGTAGNTSTAETEEARRYEVSVWNNLKATNRCGQCHAEGEEAQDYPFADPTNVNSSYSAAIALVNLENPSISAMVAKMAGGHNCWESVDKVCADIIENMISNWAFDPDNTTARAIPMTPPAIKNPGDSKTFPLTAIENSPASYAETVHVLLQQHCIACHYEEGVSQQQSPFFANPDVNSSYEAARPRINIDFPQNSRLVDRLRGGHQCWSGPSLCESDADVMQAAITSFANAISATVIDPALVTSKALILLEDGIVASGGNRHEANQIALWEFKQGAGSTAFDLTGIEPSMNLTLDGNVTWLGAYGLNFSGGKAWADTTQSKKLFEYIKLSGEYSIEAWVIPANVTQEDRNIISLDSGANNKNFALTQTLYNYNFHNRSTLSTTNGIPFLSTADAGEVLQSSLQHVVATFNPVSGRQIFVNGEAVNVSEPITQPVSIDWENNFAFVLGNSSSNSKPWFGQLRMVSIHNQVLTPAQIAQNFAVGVGQKYYLLFSIADKIGTPGTGIPDSYIRFEVSQFDSFSYLFDKPTFINLDPDWIPTAITIRKMRIGINGKPAVAGQSFATLDATIDSSYNAADGQLLSPLGAVIALEKGATLDEFFLSFEVLDGNAHNVTDAAPVPPATPADAAPLSDIGVRTFAEINATIASMTGIAVTNSAVNSLYVQYRQQLPTVETIDAFLPSHQMAIAQLALTSCSERVNLDSSLPTGDPARVLFSNVDFNESAQTAFNTAQKRANVIDPVVNAVLLNNLDSQPDQTDVANLLGADTSQTLTTTVAGYAYDSLITEMTKCPLVTDAHYNPDFPCNLTTDIYTAARTAQIVKAVCAAAVGSAAMLIQ